jgi:hypothetical protein
MVCLGNICINTLRKGAKDDDDDDDNNNNNKGSIYDCEGVELTSKFRNAIQNPFNVIRI